MIIRLRCCGLGCEWKCKLNERLIYTTELLLNGIHTTLNTPNLIKGSYMTCRTKKQLLKKLRELMDEDEPIMLADGFEEAFVGIARQAGKPIAVYHRDKCIKILIRQGMTEDEAEEFFSFNVESAYCGEQTPAYLDWILEPVLLHGKN